jgi:hypothetical protein
MPGGMQIFPHHGAPWSQTPTVRRLSNHMYVHIFLQSQMQEVKGMRYTRVVNFIFEEIYSSFVSEIHSVRVQKKLLGEGGEYSK